MNNKSPKYITKALKRIQDYCSIDHCDKCPYKVEGLNGIECIFRFSPKGYAWRKWTHENGGDI